jgi:hypothetical protein
MLHFLMYVLDWRDPLVFGWLLMLVACFAIFLRILYMVWKDWYFYYVMEDEKYER